MQNAIFYTIEDTQFESTFYNEAYSLVHCIHEGLNIHHIDDWKVCKMLHYRI